MPMANLYLSFPSQVTGMVLLQEARGQARARSVTSWRLCLAMSIWAPETSSGQSSNIIIFKLELSIVVFSCEEAALEVQMLLCLCVCLFDPKTEYYQG